MQYLSTSAMREADRRCIEDLGIPGAVLMNNAGTAVFQHLHNGPVGIVCGKGNNGGDGFVVARLALLARMDVTVVLVGTRSEVDGDARTFMEIYERLGGELIEAREKEAAGEAVAGLRHRAVLVDALLGTGIRGEVHGPARAAIDAWPDVPTLSIDTPSGLDTDTGEPCGCCVSAVKTITLQWAKQGFSASGAIPYLGDVVIADIGIPACCADDTAWKQLAVHNFGR